jgi:hypothetical protein
VAFSCIVLFRVLSVEQHHVFVLQHYLDAWGGVPV